MLHSRLWTSFVGECHKADTIQRIFLEWKNRITQMTFVWHLLVVAEITLRWRPTDRGIERHSKNWYRSWQMLVHYACSHLLLCRYKLQMSINESCSRWYAASSVMSSQVISLKTLECWTFINKNNVILIGMKHLTTWQTFIEKGGSYHEKNH